MEGGGLPIANMATGIDIMTISTRVRATACGPKEIIKIRVTSGLSHKRKLELYT